MSDKYRIRGHGDVVIESSSGSITCNDDVKISDGSKLHTSNIRSLTQAGNDPVLFQSSLSVEPPFLMSTDSISAYSSGQFIEFQSPISFSGTSGIINNVQTISTLTNGAGNENQVLTSRDGQTIWADPSGGNASEWSQYPSTQTLNMANNDIVGIKTLEGLEGNFISVVPDIVMSNSGIQGLRDIENMSTNVIGCRSNFTLDVGKTLKADIINASNAGGDINLATNINFSSGGIISNITQLGGSGDIDVTHSLDLQFNDLKNVSKLGNPYSGFGTAGQFLMSNGTQPMSWADAPSAQNWSSYAANSTLHMANNAIDNISSVETTTLTAQSITSTSGSLQIIDGTVSLKSGQNTTFQIETGGLFQIRGNQGQFFMYDTSDAQATILASTALNFLNSNNQANMSGWGTISCQRLNPIIVNENVYYVSPTGVNSGNEKGSMEYPYQTIQYAISQTEALTAVDNKYRYICVLAGSYNENLTITKKVFIRGMGNTPFEASVGCQIGGSITINVDSNGGDMFNNCVSISGFLIGSQVEVTSSANSVFNLDNCYIYTNNDTNGRGIYYNPSSTDGRLRITNCLIVSGGTSGLNPLVHVNKAGSVTMYQTVITAKGVQPCLRFSGTATCDNLSMCKFENSSSSASVPALVEITSTNSASHTFNNCSFIYSSATDKSLSMIASGIFSNASAGQPVVTIMYCTFFLTGLGISGFAVQDAKTGTANQLITYFQNSGAPQGMARQIRGTTNTNKYAFANVF